MNTHSTNGFKATLTLEANEGEVFASLKVGLGCEALSAAQAAMMHETQSTVKKPRSLFSQAGETEAEKLQVLEKKLKLWILM